MAKGKYEKWITPEGLGKIQGWAEDGLDDRQIYEQMDITSSTFYVWVNSYPEISEALARGRGRAQARVENSLFERACGGVRVLMKQKKRRVREYDPVTGKCVKDEEIFVALPEEEFIPPDTPAIKFWLINRAPERWAEKVQVDGSGKLTLEELLGDG